MFDQLRNRRACYKNASRLFGKDGESNGATLSFVLFFFPKNVNRCSSEIKPEEITRSDGKITGPVCGDYEHVSDSGKSRDRGRINIYSQGMAKREREREREREISLLRATSSSIGMFARSRAGKRSLINVKQMNTP